MNQLEQQADERRHKDLVEIANVLGFIALILGLAFATELGMIVGQLL